MRREPLRRHHAGARVVEGDLGGDAVEVAGAGFAPAAGDRGTTGVCKRLPATARPPGRCLGSCASVNQPSPELLLGAAAAVLLVSLLIAVLSWWRRRPLPAAPPAAAAAAEPASPWTAFRAGLSKTRALLGARLRETLGRDRTLAAWLDDLEEALILADVGLATTQRLIAALRRHPGLDSATAVLEALKAEIRALLGDNPPERPTAKPLVILVAGVNGVGKTTSIGKLAHRYRSAGNSVLLVAADTFRAAASEQLEVWAERAGCDLVKHQSGADPSAVVFDGLKAAQSRGADVVIIDTAGRLHVKANLMEELKKIVRVIGREIPAAPHESFLVLDATTGQNALSQTRLFQEALPLTGVILTKLDGTAKGGVVLAVKSELQLPIRYVGLGEALDDLRPFEAEAFTAALFEPAAA
ncbi:MAG: signal recognition particle-docking protein FtsY [Deltaproteobacteria bacterium]|nr:signal recognition particle-docking protein FtsY [Deltaproteobacteria bacterium]